MQLLNFFKLYKLRADTIFNCTPLKNILNFYKVIVSKFLWFNRKSDINTKIYNSKF